jgi:hypothetical protein
MKTRYSITIAALMFGFATLVAALPLQEEMLVEGVLTSIDIESKTLSVKTTSDEEMNLKYTDDTKIVGQDETMQWLKERVGTKVKINYKLVEEKPQAIRVEVSQAAN